MQHTNRLIPIVLVSASLGLVAPPLVVALSLLRIPPTWAALSLVGLGIAAAWRWRYELNSLAAPLLERRLWLALWLVGSLAASIQGARLGLFMLDAKRADDSVVPWQAFFREHSCLTAYTEAARLAPSGVNVYDPKLYLDPLAEPPRYARRIGPFVVDLFEYPPPFLVLPRLAVAQGLDFLRIRSSWFALQSLLSIASVLALATWIGGRSGLRAGLLLPVLWAAPPILLTLQIGNFQLTALSLGVLAMLAFARERPVQGGLALGFATSSKIFPGVLGLWLLASRRWRAVLWTLAASVVLVALALVLLGRRPLIDFFQYQLPRISSGEAFDWIEVPSVALINASAYGLVTKLRLLGLPWTEKPGAEAFTHLYALALLPLVLLAAWRRRRGVGVGMDQEVGRLRQAQAWLGLLNLASFRSPFVPDAYATIGSLWLLTLLAAERRTLLAQAGLLFAGLAFCRVLDDAALPSPPPLWVTALTLTSQLVLLGLNVWVVVRPLPRAQAVVASVDLILRPASARLAGAVE